MAASKHSRAVFKAAASVTFIFTVCSFAVIGSAQDYSTYEKEPTVISGDEVFEEVRKNIETSVQYMDSYESEYHTEEPTEVRVMVSMPEHIVTEEPAPLRENTLYYILDEGVRCDISTDLQDYVYNKCVENNIESYYELILAQIYHESGWKSETISSTDDYGLMQINIQNHEWLSETLGITDFLDPYQSIDAGTYLMSSYLLKYNDVQKALVCYNMGEGKVKDGIWQSKYSNGVVEDMDKLIAISEEE